MSLDKEITKSRNRFICIQDARWLDTFDNKEINSYELTKIANELDMALRIEKQKGKNAIRQVYEAINERYNLEGKEIDIGFGDKSFGSYMISAKDLKQFLQRLIIWEEK